MVGIYIKALMKGASKVSPTIKSVKPSVPKTKLEKAKSKLAIAKQKTKASGAKLKQTLFESKNKAFKGNDFTFATSTKKTPSNTELKDQADYLNKTGKYKVKKAKGGRVGLKRGTGLRRPSNVEKIKKAFGSKKSLGMQSVIYGLDKNPKITAADPKAKFIAAANKKKKTKKKII